MAITRYFASAGACSWIDPVTKLPEVDSVPPPSSTTTRSFLVGNAGYRFSNFMEVFVDFDTTLNRIVASGFTSNSGMYRGPSFMRIPSHAFGKTQYSAPFPNHIYFTQVVGARTVSPEMIGTVVGGAVGAGVGVWGGAKIGAAIGTLIEPGGGTIVGGVIGGVGGLVGGAFLGDVAAHQASAFPPIWSKIQIRLYDNGHSEAELLQHSHFPSLTFYRTHAVLPLNMTTVVPNDFDRSPYITGSTHYDARKPGEYDTWQASGWGRLAATSTPGPTNGNPWGIEKGWTGGESDLPTPT